ncbi:MAG: HypC/HybG/HupF family hydrogenase formation chaperone [Candidatus Daviesbacteria bacterium]|nr:HypC/HybG/HupF family hydrogenase formation chaperone [Candidatus Daviesbacteria bacterium]
MCLAIPGRVKKIEGKKILVSYSGEIRQVLTGDEKVKVGGWVLVQMGIVIKVLTSKEALELLKTD